MPDILSTHGPLRVLLIDDNPDDRALVERELRLRIERVEVRHISDAAALAEALGAGGFDVAVTDYRLRWTVGTEVLRDIKGRYPSAPVIMFTGSGNEEVAVDAMKEGLDDYITKTPKHYPRVPFAVLACFERVNNRARLQASVARESLAKARLEVALQSAGMATWQLDLATMQLSCSIEAGPMFGHPPGFVHASPVEALAQVHPEDAVRLQALWDTVLDGTSRVAAEFRVLGPDGQVRWIAGSAKLLQHDGSRERLVIGTLRDVTAEVLAKEAQRKQQEELQAILDVLPVGIAISRDAEARHISITPYFSALLGVDHGVGYERIDTEERPYRYLRAGEPIEPDDWPMRVAARLGKPVRGEELDVQFPDGRSLTILVNAAPLFDPQGRVRGAVAAIMDVSALKNVQRELEKANRQKSEFLSVLAHELRNPMAAIGYSVEMLRHVASPATIGKARDVITRQTRHMGRLLDDLLDLSRITLNRIVLDTRPVDLRRTIELAYESTRALIESLGHDIRFDLPASPIMVLGDEVRLTQVISNILNNAAKFTPAHGAITVRAACGEGRAVVTVSDNGAGIAPDQLESVFEMFSQGQSKVSGGAEGLGIGLAVVRKLVDLHGGTAQASSEGSGRGTTVRVELPCMDPGAAEEQAPAGAVPAAGTHVRLLVADDNIDAADLLADVLRLEGYAVQVAYDGREAMQMAEQWRPDALVLDIGMPHANGIEVARWVRAQDWGRKVALVAVTGWGQQQDRSATLEAGFDDHLVKPVSPQDVTAAVSRHLAR
ncbi:hybrid sensor histidine kinase/response regulator [Massilia sp. BSC265]|uniref:hybrid sensor histidine kinase/response regulator n=1 Tax=Massilia sp. BSC265 TaxID=1549812 RepID=UPI00068E9A3E|nr:hybrid sensor histidine kinase/response regulator [Massilia sp. BSC265]